MSRSWKISRRTFLRGAGASLSLPLLEAMPARVQAETKSAAAPRRLVCVGNPYGMIPDRFFPEQTGPDFPLPPLLAPMQQHRGGFTVFSSLDHGISGGH